MIESTPFQPPSVLLSAGLASFLSPCVLPLVPVDIASLAGHESHEKI